VGNTFGATAFSSYGGFWMSLAALHIKSFGFLDGYAGDASLLNRALGIYLFSWCVFSLIMTVASHRTTAVLVTLFATVALTFLLLAIGHWAEVSECTKAGGAVGLLAAAIAWYAALAGLLTKSNSHFTLPVWPLHDEEDKAHAMALTNDLQLQTSKV
jgi:succinate-acetate transporter protein